MRVFGGAAVAIALAAIATSSFETAWAKENAGRGVRDRAVRSSAYRGLPGVQEIYAPAATAWGSWATSIDYCPYGSYVNGFRLHSEPSQGSGGGEDDTALNRIELRCADGRTGATTKMMSSNYERWGVPRNWQVCPERHFMYWYQLKSEGDQGGGDDTAANGLRMGCRPFGSNQPLPSRQVEDPGDWGSAFSGEAFCSGNNLVVGLRTRVEWGANNQDDTALNDVKFYCYSPTADGRATRTKRIRRGK